MKLKKISVLLLLCLGMACAGCKYEEKESQISEEINVSQNTIEIPEQYC